MSEVKPLNVLSAKSLQLLQKLKPEDQIVLKRDASFFGLEVSELFEQRTPPTYTEWYTAAHNYSSVNLMTYHNPAITYSTGEWYVEVPTVVEVAQERNQDVVDFRDIQPSEEDQWNALDFVRELEVLPARTDYRDNYIDYASKPKLPKLRAQPVPPAIDSTHPLYQPYYVAYNNDLKLWKAEKAIFEHEMGLYPYRLSEWARKNNLEKITPDGRYLSQNVALKITSRSVAQARRFTGADDQQLPDVPMLVKAIQELSQQIITLRGQLQSWKSKG